LHTIEFWKLLRFLLCFKFQNKFNLRPEFITHRDIKDLEDITHIQKIHYPERFVSRCRVLQFWHFLKMQRAIHLTCHYKYIKCTLPEIKNKYFRVNLSRTRLYWKIASNKFHSINHFEIHSTVHTLMNNRQMHTSTFP
jgi:hypothetical protein